MARKKRAEVPPSLVHLFEPPEGFRGLFGWLCGYAADSDFLELATERFTQLTHPRRAHRGCVSLVAMLDRGNRQIGPTEVPGLLHVALRGDARHDFALLHAKVALLGFVGESNADDWRLRLIVSTGNWTAQTLDRSLDLAWHLDLGAASLLSPTEDTRQALVDVQAGASFLTDLRSQCDMRALAGVPSAQRTSESALAAARVDRWLQVVSSQAGNRRSRFFDNRKSALIDQLPPLVRYVSGGAVARNYLAMGSGFYEGPSGSDKIPHVLGRIVDALQKGSSQRLLTNRPEIDVFVNPLACQAVASAAPAFEKDGWRVRPAATPDWLKGGGRTLHAKFIFSANYRSRTHCTSGWVYLGSGNLTKPGFACRAGRNSGNLEAGVVLSCGDVEWDTLAELLPIQWDIDYNEAPEDLQAGAEMEEKPPVYFAPPIAFLQVIELDGRLWLRAAAGNDPEDVEVLGPAGRCQFVPGRGFSWPNQPAPRQVRVRWKDKAAWREAEIPVIDEYGRVAATPLQAMDLDSAWAQLMNFPLPPPEEDIDSDGTQDDPNPPPHGLPAPKGRKADYPIRAVMTLIENIAGLQERLQRADWPTWCMRLEQTLSLSAQCPTVAHCKNFGINILSPLRERPFRPPFAQDRSTEAGDLYEALLDRVEALWGLKDLVCIGKAP